MTWERGKARVEQRPGDDIDPSEVPVAIAQAGAIVTAARQLAPQLTLFR